MNINHVFKEVSKDTPFILALFTVVCCERRTFIFFHVLPLQVNPSFLSSLLNSSVPFVPFIFLNGLTESLSEMKVAAWSESLVTLGNRC